MRRSTIALGRECVVGAELFKGTEYAKESGHPVARCLRCADRWEANKIGWAKANFVGLPAATQDQRSLF
jgi:hypothetical protein